MIEIDSLYKSFGKTQVLRGATFTAQQGRVTAILGPNGCGKTTTFRIIAGLLLPDGGQVRIGGVDPVEDPEGVRELVSILPENRGLRKHLSGREAIRLQGNLYGMGGRELESRIDELAHLLRMTDFIDRRSSRLSRGQALKVSLGRALVKKVPIVILDEPTIGLDFISAEAVRDVISGLRDSGVTVLLATHVVPEIERLADDIIMLRDGKVIVQDTIETIRERAGSHGLARHFISIFGENANFGSKD